MFTLAKIEDAPALKEMIGKRCSKRKFTGKIAEETLEKLKKFIENINAIQQDFRVHYVVDEGKVLSPLLFKIIRGTSELLAFEVVGKDVVQANLSMGFFGELLDLYITSLGLGSVWMAGDGFTFSSKAVKNQLHTENPIPVVIPIGNPADPTYVASGRKTMEKLAPQWPAEKKAEFELLNRAPSSLNKQPYTLETTLNDQKELSEIRIKLNKPQKKDDLSSAWLDAGIVAAHAALMLGADAQMSLSEAENVLVVRRE